MNMNMNIKRFDEKELAESLRSMPPGSRTAFAVAAATRQLGNYERFATKFDVAAIHRPREIVEELWADIQSGSADHSAWSHVLEEVLALIPDEDEVESWSIDHSLADDALSSLAYAIRCHLKRDSQEAAWAARRAYEAADQAAICSLGVQPGSPTVEATIKSHGFVQRELERQNDDLSLLREGLVDEVRRRSNDLPLLSEQEAQAMRHI